MIIAFKGYKFNFKYKKGEIFIPGLYTLPQECVEQSIETGWRWNFHTAIIRTDANNEERFYPVHNVYYNLLFDISAFYTKKKSCLLLYIQYVNGI